MDPRDLVAMISALNPTNEAGRVSVIVRMGAANVRKKFPAMVEAVRQVRATRGGEVTFWLTVIFTHLVHMKAHWRHSKLGLHLRYQIAGPLQNLG